MSYLKCWFSDGCWKSIPTGPVLSVTLYLLSPTLPFQINAFMSASQFQFESCSKLQVSRFISESQTYSWTQRTKCPGSPNGLPSSSTLPCLALFDLRQQVTKQKTYYTELGDWVHNSRSNASNSKFKVRSNSRQKLKTKDKATFHCRQETSHIATHNPHSHGTLGLGAI